MTTPTASPRRADGLPSALRASAATRRRADRPCRGTRPDALWNRTIGFISTWCAFAAIVSVVMLGWVRRRTQTPGPAA
ncbi:DUF6629 family protein [Streptomyces sp. S4.7]|uniref:DUF6629 family protein n=1 Tax=Streptomyces sp. S4.7 TaxID=2705439 RepID=UPI0031BA8BDA